MIIEQTGISDSTIVQPNNLFLEVSGRSNMSMDSEIINLQQHRSSKHKRRKNSEMPPTQNEMKYSTAKKKDRDGLKRLIREQKVNNIIKKFIGKMKLNNINSAPVEFQPYYQTEQVYFYDTPGFEISDWLEKLISALIVVTIMICVFLDTTYLAFPVIVEEPLVYTFQLFSLFVFLFEFVSSMCLVKMVEGKKVEKIGALFKCYLQEGLIMDLAYIVVLMIDLFGDAGNFKLIILLKLPECFERIEKIENSVINTFYKEQYWGLAKVFLLNFALSHFIALLLILMARIDPEKSWLTVRDLHVVPASEQYTWAYYWGTTIMLTVGFGDLSPSNHQQAICVMLIETFSCLALAYNINCVGNLISNIKSQDIEKNKSIKTFKILSNRNDLTEDLQMKIHNYIEESTNIKKKFNFEEESNFISTLPRELKADFLKESNKKIFENLIFFKNLTEKTLLSFAEAIQMKICHPEEIIKKRGELSGVSILKEGKVGLCSKLNGSDFSNTTVQTISISQGQEPFLLSLDFLSNDRATYELKSEEYSILYYMDKEKAIECFKTGELDFEHFCFLRDKARNMDTDFEVIACENCQTNHSRFECPKLHYCPLKKHVIDKYLHASKINRSSRRPFQRQKTTLKPFDQFEAHIKMFDIKESTMTKYIGIPTKSSLSQNKGERPKSQKQTSLKQVDSFGKQIQSPSFRAISGPNDFCNNVVRRLMSSHRLVSHSELFQNTATLTQQNVFEELSTDKRIEYQVMADMLKGEMEKIITTSSDVWLIESDEVKNFKFYFVSYNASTLEYLKRKTEETQVPFS